MLKEGVQAAEGLFSVIIVCIDYSKGLMEYLPAGQKRLSGSPKLFPPSRNLRALWHILQLLEGIGHLYPSRRQISSIRSPITWRKSASMSRRMMNTILSNPAAIAS